MDNKLPHLYAFLVGIDNYHPLSRVCGLMGCAADIEAMDTLLRTHAPGNYDYQPMQLLNEAATRAGVCDGFAAHLGQAGNEDIVLFMFSGHGSRQPSAVEFQGEKGEDETLVCYDSRLPGCHDLADKELAVLLSRIQCRHLLVILDCCHGGSGTRNTWQPAGQVVRMIPASHASRRQLSSYAQQYYSELLANEGRISVPLRPHLLLAACGPHQLAAEASHGRGAFSYSLEKVIRENGFQVSYEHLFEQTRALMVQEGYLQTPQFECHGGEDWELSFLGLQAVPSVANPLRVYEGMPGRWFVDFGAMHGLPDGSETELRVRLKSAERELGTYPLRSLGPERSEIAVPRDFAPSSGATVLADLGFIALGKTRLDVRGSGLELDRLRWMLPEWVGVTRPIGSDQVANFRLQCRSDGKVKLVDAHSETVLQYASDASLNNLNLLMGTVVKVLRWRNVAKMSNGSMESYFDTVKVKFALYRRDGTRTAVVECLEKKRLPHTLTDQAEYFPEVRICNGSSGKVYVYLFHLGGNHSIELLETREYLDGVKDGLLWGGNGERGLYLPNWKQEAVDRFAVLIATEPIEAWKMAQRGFEPGSEVRGTRDLVERNNSMPLRWVCRRWELWSYKE